MLSRKYPKVMILLTVVGLLLLSACNVAQPVSSPTATLPETASPIETSTEADESTETETLPELRIEGRDWGYPSPYAFYTRGPGYVRMTLLFDSLIWRDDTKVVPWLAEEWQSSADGTTWQVKLAEDVTWHDGEPFTADDVKFTFDYLKTYPHPWFNQTVIDQVEIISPHEVTFHLNSPYAVFETRVLGRIPIFPQHIWQTVDDPYNFVDEQAVIGTGPFKLGDYDATQGSYLYTANSEFFKGSPTVDRLIFVPTKTPDISLLEGDIDMARILNIDSLGMFEGQPEFKIVTAPDYWLFRLVINFNQPPLDQTEFRQALAYALNRPEMVNRVAHDGAVPGTYAYVSPASEWHNPEVADYPYNPDKAKTLLDNLNLTDTDGDGIREQPSGEPLAIILLSDNRFTRAAEAVKKYLEAVGLQVTIDSTDVSTHDSRIREMQDFHLALTAHGGVSADLGNLATGLPAIKGYQNEEYLSLVQQQPYLIDPSERKEALWRIQTLIAEDVATIPLYYLQWFHVYRPAVFDNWFYTHYGLPLGVQLLENKLAFIEQ